MKNLLKLVPILLLTITLSCKKKDPKPAAFDITKYSVVGKFSTGFPYIITIEAGDKVTLTSYSITIGKYTYIDGVFKFDFNNGELPGSFIIENGSIKSYNGPALIKTYELVKIPQANQLEGKSFKGSWNGLGYQTQLNFTGTKYTEIGNNQQTDTNYTLINNLAVKKEEGTSITLFVMMDNKLEGGRYKNQTTVWGTFMKM